MRRMLLAAGMALFAAASSAWGQAARVANADNSELIAKNVYKRLFEGVVLTTDQADKARAIIRSSISSQLSAPPQENRYRALIRMSDERDSLLVALFSTPSDREKVATQARSLRTDTPAPPKPAP